MRSARAYLPKPRNTILGTPSAICTGLALDGRAERLDHALLILGVELWIERKRQRSRACVLGDRKHAFAEAVALAHVRLQMNARRVRAGLDTALLELVDDPRAVDAAGELDDVDEPRAAVVGVS